MQERDEGIPRIVITGGPSSGKTTMVRELSRILPRLTYTKEAATIVLEDNWPMPSEEYPWTQQWQNRLQKQIGQVQLQLEGESQVYARRTASPLIIQDRGLLDINAYLEDTNTFPEYTNGISAETALKRYTAVIHLGWIAGKRYESDSNPIRFEDQATAEKLGQAVLDVWSEHPRLIQVTKTEHRLGQVLDIIQPMLRNI